MYGIKQCDVIVFPNLYGLLKIVYVYSTYMTETPTTNNMFSRLKMVNCNLRNSMKKEDYYYCNIIQIFV